MFVFHRHVTDDAGFTIVELVIVVSIIAILLLIAMPRFFGTQTRASQRACFQNQRSIEGAVSVWLAEDTSRTHADIEGVVTRGNPLVDEGSFKGTPRCPAAPDPANTNAPTAAEGAYTLDADGDVEPCTFGIVEHGHF